MKTKVTKVEIETVIHPRPVPTPCQTIPNQGIAKYYEVETVQRKAYPRTTSYKA